MTKKDYLDEKKFECEKCGECCKPKILCSEEDIDRIKKTGLLERSFIEQDNSDDKVMKQKYDKEDYYCIFFDTKSNMCKIYDHRPEVCRKYPFFDNGLKIKSCKPKEIFRQKFGIN